MLLVLHPARIWWILRTGHKFAVVRLFPPSWSGMRSACCPPFRLNLPVDHDKDKDKKCKDRSRRKGDVLNERAAEENTPTSNAP